MSEKVRFAFGFALLHLVIAYKLAPLPTQPQDTPKTMRVLLICRQSFGDDTNSLLTRSCNIAPVGVCNDSKEGLFKNFKGKCMLYHDWGRSHVFAPTFDTMIVMFPSIVCLVGVRQLFWFWFYDTQLTINLL